LNGADVFPALQAIFGERARRDVSLAPLTTFRVGGPAEVLIRPADEADLAQFLAALPPDVPVHTLGACSNLIIRDGGLPGVVIRLARGFGTVTAESDGVVAGAAALDVTVAERAAEVGLGGLEFLSGIPGSIGGAVVMNGGAYGGDVATCLDWAEIVTRSGEQRRLSAADLAFAYRHSRLPHGAVVVRARLRAQRGSPTTIAARMAEIRATREASQPVRARTGGSTFRNPPDLKAWELIDAAGCRGKGRTISDYGGCYKRHLFKGVPTWGRPSQEVKSGRSHTARGFRSRSRRSSSIRASSSSSMTPTARAPIFTKRSLPVLIKFS